MVMDSDHLDEEIKWVDLLSFMYMLKNLSFTYHKSPYNKYEVLQDAWLWNNRHEHFGLSGFDWFVWLGYAWVIDYFGKV